MDLGSPGRELYRSTVWKPAALSTQKRLRCRPYIQHLLAWIPRSEVLLFRKSAYILEQAFRASKSCTFWFFSRLALAGYCIYNNPKQTSPTFLLSNHQRGRDSNHHQNGQAGPAYENWDQLQQHSGKAYFPLANPERAREQHSWQCSILVCIVSKLERASTTFSHNSSLARNAVEAKAKRVFL